MDRQLITYIFRFILLVLTQVFVLNNIQFSGILNPYIYVYFLIVLPVDFRPTVGLIVGFLLGLTMDMFCQTLGMHTIAATFAAYCRPYVLTYMAPRDGYEFSRVPGVRQMGWLWFLTYAAIIVFLHHFVLFFIEMFRVTGILLTLGKSLGSSLMSMSIIIVIQLIFARSGNSYE